MPRAGDYQSYRPANYDTKREITNTAKLENQAWHTSANALAEFLTRAYTPNDIEKALADAVADRRFESSAVHNQRLHIKLYFTVWNLMWKRQVRSLPWPQRDLDKLLSELKREPAIEAIGVDFLAIMFKLTRGAAFDHLIGLTNTIVSINYLPGVKKLLERRHNEPRPIDTRRGSGAAATTPTTPSTPSGFTSNLDSLRNAQQAPMQPVDRGVQVPVSPVTTTTRIPTPPIRQLERPVEPPSAGTTSRVGNPETSPRLPTESRPVLPPGSFAGRAFYQEGLASLSETNMMPFKHQHYLFRDVLGLLERACFSWAEKAIPDVLKSKKWKTWEMVELLEWTDILSASTTPLYISSTTRAALVDTILPGLKQMRNDSIRRTVLPIAAVTQMMKHAKSLMVILKDDARQEILSGIAERLIKIEQGSIEKRQQLKKELEAATGDIAKKYMKLWEDEIKAQSERSTAEMEQHLDSCDWAFKLETPSDERRAGGEVNQSANTPEVAPQVIPSAEVSISGPSTNTRSTSSVAQRTPDKHHERQSSETDSVAAPIYAEGQGPPPRGTAEYEAFWIASRNSNTALPPVALVKDALNIDGKTWEDVRQVATAIIEENDLLDVRWKDIQANHPLLIQKFKGMNIQVFKDVKTKAFWDLLCELTFHSATRGIRERGRRRQSRHRAKEAEPTTSASNDPRIKNREARLAGRQDEVHDPRLRIREGRHARVLDDPDSPSTSREAAAREREARLANLQAQALKPSTSAANRQPDSAHSGRPRGGDYLEEDNNVRISPNKRSLSPADDRQDAQKRVKVESHSQEDMISILSPAANPDHTNSAA